MAQLQEPPPSAQALGHATYMDEVAPSIWLGEKRAAFDSEVETLKKHGISHVVSVGFYQEWWKFRDSPRHLLLSVGDSPYAFITEHFSEVFKFMDDALSLKQSVLVHCEQGRSRSGALVIAYLMRRHRQSYPETLKQVLVHRKRVMPNIGFQIQLRAFAKHKWDPTLAYSDKLIDIDKELQTALKNLAHQVSRLQLDIRASEKIFVTFEADADEAADSHKNNKRLVRIGLGNDDLSQYRKEWVLLVFLCHQFQLYDIAVNNSIITILHILGEMYFEDLVDTFIEVFEPINQGQGQGQAKAQAKPQAMKQPPLNTKSKNT